jgi:hypothetical protein
MELSRDQASQLYAAGTVPLPPHFPEVGILTRATAPLRGSVVCVELRISDANVTRYFARIRDVRAVVDARGKQRDPDYEVWYFGKKAQQFLKRLPSEFQTPTVPQQVAQPPAQQQAPQQPERQKLIDLNTYGVVLLRKAAGVLVQTDQAMSASDVEDHGRGCCRREYEVAWGCCKSPCCGWGCCCCCCKP